MNRIEQTFENLKQQQKTAFIGFLTAGDPNIEISKACVLELDKNGCDIIEIGIPFSDPAAEGPVIQEASLRALQHNITTDNVLAMVRDLRNECKAPLVFLLYYNQIFKYGIEPFLVECEKAGIDGLIIPDLPYEHREELLPFTQAHHIQLISLVTPISERRKEMIAKNSEGFLYCVTSLGVTGERSTFEMDLRAFIKELNTYTDTPKALGFGISTVEQIQEFKTYADGVIVGSAIVREIGKIADGTGSVETVGKLVHTLAEACH